MGDLFAAGMETTSTTLCWIIIYLLHHPQVQDKCYQEIVQAVGTGRQPRIQDKTLLPYLEATVMETQRLANLVPLGIQHSVSRDVVFHGYLIPQNAIIFSLMSSVLHDEKIWPSPNEFRPERFLDKDGKLTRPEEFIPFSLGKNFFLVLF
jgi:cytochrome P450